jgi:hypothetical protein
MLNILCAFASLPALREIEPKKEGCHPAAFVLIKPEYLLKDHNLIRKDHVSFFIHHLH